jgi:hypothetical protein
MASKKSTVTIPVDPVRAANPIEKWRKRNGLTTPEAAKALGYNSVGGYHRLVRCEMAPLDKLAKFSEISGSDLKTIADYFKKHRSTD